MMNFLKEFATFLWARKIWWMAPLVIVLIGLGSLLFLAEGSVVAPFIYTLF